MSSPNSPDAGPPPSREEMISALFANLVVQQTNMALMFLGQVPNPQSGEQVRDLEAARMFIDQLEMLEVKTKGNLDQREAQLLKQSLTHLRMAFVDAVEAPGPGAPGPTAARPEAAAPRESGSAPSAGPQGSTPTSEEEHRKKFTKKY